MTYEEERRAIEGMLHQLWQGRVTRVGNSPQYNVTPTGEPVWFKYEQVPYWHFNGETSLSSAPKGPWIALFIQDIDTRTNGIGGSDYRMRHDGRIVAQVFVPANGGTNCAVELAEMVGDVYAPARFNGIKTYSSEVRRVGDTDDGLYQVNVVIDFHRYSVKQDHLRYPDITDWSTYFFNTYS